MFSCENTTDHRSRSDLTVSRLCVSHTQVSVITMSLRGAFMSQHQDRSITALPAARGKVRRIRRDESLQSDRDADRQDKYGSQPKCRMCSTFLNFLSSSLLFPLPLSDETNEREREIKTHRQTDHMTSDQ